jgi:CBS domain-containing protein
MSSQHPMIRAGRRMVAVHPGTDAFTALSVMRNAETRHLPVVEGDRCVGLLTEADLLRALAATATVPATSDLTVGSLCHRPAPSVPAGSSLQAMAERMLLDGTDAALVVARGVMVGMVTSTDVLGAVTGRGRARQEPA